VNQWSNECADKAKAVTFTVSVLSAVLEFPVKREEGFFRQKKEIVRD
jgi:hypothetical protein